jgi:phage terminase large subunit-like protein
MAKRPRNPISNWREVLSRIPGYDPYASAGDCVFDEAAAVKPLNFFHACLSHVKGERAGQPFDLSPWQAAILANLFGWKRPDGTRRYREAFIFVPRKNGKSILAAGICNYCLFCDGEPGAEIYCAAAERDQARLVFDVAKQQVLAEPALSRAAKVFTHAIVLEGLNSSFKSISAEANTKHGYNSHCVVVDELHAQNTRDLVDVLVTSTGARRQPLIVYITTSDYQRESVCNEKYEYAVKVRDGVIKDPYFLPVIYEAPKDSDWKDPGTWRAANPGLGQSISEEYLARECQRAQDSPAYENTFKRLHLNLRTEQDTRWLSIDTWDACDEVYALEDLRERKCWGGLDLSTTTDLSSLVLAFPIENEDGSTKVIALPFFWAPKERAVERERRDRVPYLTWARQGFLELTPGNVVDYDYIRSKINELGRQYEIVDIAVDRWNATQLATQLGHDGFELVSFGQGFASMSSPTKELEKLVVGRTLVHSQHPVLRWMASNVTVEMDAAGNLKPSKSKSEEKIDGIVALIMAIGRLATRKATTCYQDRGLLTL